MSDETENTASEAAAIPPNDANPSSDSSAQHEEADFSPNATETGEAAPISVESAAPSEGTNESAPPAEPAAYTENAPVDENAPSPEAAHSSEESAAPEPSPAPSDEAAASEKPSDENAGAAETPAPEPEPAPVVFHVDQKVVYPSQGVGVIREIVTRTFKNQPVPYYVVYLEVTDMTIMVPQDKAVSLGIRPIVDEAEAARAVELLGEEFEPNPSDWKMRYQMNLDLLKKGTVIDIATIVRSLYHRSKVKELPILERKLYDSAQKLLQDEVAYSLNKPKDEVESMIFSRLEAR